MLRDPKLLNMFRELLVIFRIWGLIRHSCLPTFSYMENVDVIATLFRILTRLLQTSEPDESLLGNIYSKCFLKRLLLHRQRLSGLSYKSVVAVVNTSHVRKDRPLPCSIKILFS